MHICSNCVCTQKNSQKTKKKSCKIRPKIKHIEKTQKLYNNPVDMKKSIINIFCFLIPLPRTRRNVREYLKKKFLYQQEKNIFSFIKKLKRNRPIILWIDHSLGGGTETYTKNQFETLTKKNNVIRMQYWPWIQKYSLTIGKKQTHRYMLKNYHILKNFVKN
jgi:hypothetical protein